MWVLTCSVEEHTLLMLMNNCRQKLQLLHKVTGQNVDLKRFDQLRLLFREQQYKKQKPTISEREEYETLMAKLQNCVLSCKYTTKAALKSMEKDYIANRLAA